MQRAVPIQCEASSPTSPQVMNAARKHPGLMKKTMTCILQN